MTWETKDYINRLTQHIIKYYDISIPIIDMIDAVGKIGGTVVEKEAFDSVYDPIAMKTGESSFQIYVAKHQDEYKKRKEISIALGHVMLHMGYMTNNSIWIAQETNIPVRFRDIEQHMQAMEFAHALLMPKDEFVCIADINSNDKSVDAEVVAEHFNVPAYDAINRGRSIGIFQPIHPN